MGSVTRSCPWSCRYSTRRAFCRVSSRPKACGDRHCRPRRDPSGRRRDRSQAHRAPALGALAAADRHARVPRRRPGLGRHRAGRPPALRRVRRPRAPAPRNLGLPVAAAHPPLAGRRPRDGPGRRPRAGAAGLGARVRARPARGALAVAAGGGRAVRGRAPASPALAGQRVRACAAGLVVDGRGRRGVFHDLPLLGVPAPQPDPPDR